MRILKASFLYFPIRHEDGRADRAAPQLVVTILAARWVARHLSVPSIPSSRLGMGCLALGLLPAAEFALVLRLRGLSIDEYLTSRGPVSGTASIAMLGVVAIMPLFVGRRSRR